jgi:hypothetical protein
MKEPPRLSVDAARRQPGPVRSEVCAVVAQGDVVAGFRHRTRTPPEPVRMDVPPAERQHVESRVRELGPAAPVLGNEDVSAPFVVKDPADVAAGKVSEVEVSLVGEAPDPFARVVQRAGTTFSGPSGRVDVLPRRCRLRLGSLHRTGRLAGARRGQRQEAEEDRRVKMPHDGIQYGSAAVREPEFSRSRG